MSVPDHGRHALVLGASGFVGRHLLRALAGAGGEVTAAVRTPASAARLQHWLREHGVTRPVATVIVDFASAELVPGDRSALATVTEIHNCAGSYRFGMSAQEAREANVGIVERLIDVAAGLPALRRVVHVSGYRVGGQDPATVPWSDDHRAAVYARLGAYEASKVESDAVFQARASARGIPWTIVNPASVIGDSVTGESDQQIGLADTIQQLWRGRMAALPGGDAIFLPVVTVDHLAAFMERVAVDPAAESRAYWLLDDDTPPLRDLLSTVGRHLGVPIPRLTVPVGVIRRLPARVTRVDPETLSFMSSDRYPTGSADALAAAHGISTPDVRLSLHRWADHLVAHRFGDAPGGDRRFVDHGGIRTFEIGRAGSRRVILPGLPVNADTWARVAAGTGARAVDLPGLGLSGGTGLRDWTRWLAGLTSGEPLELIGHSLGAAAALAVARRFPERLRSLTLVSPFFLQVPPRGAARVSPVVRAFLRHADAVRLSRRLTGTDAGAAALESSVSDLRRTGAKHAAAQLSRAGSERWRAQLRDALRGFDGPVRIVVGSEDPLDARFRDDLGPRVEIVSLPGAGHHPQLTHAEALTEVLSRPVA